MSFSIDFGFSVSILGSFERLLIINIAAAKQEYKNSKQQKKAEYTKYTKSRTNKLNMTLECDIDSSRL